MELKKNQIEFSFRLQKKKKKKKLRKIESFILFYFQLKSFESDNYLAATGENLHGSQDVFTKINEISAKPNQLTGNGSVITMTMKNNHLIVETEERSVSLRKY